MFMKLESRTYTPLDYVKIPFRIAPLLTLSVMALLTASALVPSLLIGLTAGFVNAALTLAGSAHTVAASPNSPIENGLAVLARPLALLALTLLASRLASLSSKALKLRLGRRMREQIDPQILRKRGSLAYSHIEHDATWDLIARVGKEPSERLSGAFYNLLDAAEALIRIVGILVVLTSQVWWIGALTLAVSFPLMKTAFSLGREDYQAYAAARKPMRRADALREMLSSRADVEERALFGYGEAVGRRWNEAFEEASRIIRQALRSNFVRTKSAAILASLLGLVISLLLLLPLTRGTLSAGMYVGLATAVWNLSEQMSWRLSQVLQQVAENRAFLDDWSAFMQLDEAEGAEDLPDFAVRNLPPEAMAIAFEDVSFAYPGSERPILDGLTLTLEAGKRYAIVGRNGAGKSTIVKLLTGLYTDYSGRITLAGRDLREWSAAERKAAFSVTFQDYANYEVPLRDQVMLGSKAFSGGLNRDEDRGEAGTGDEKRRSDAGQDSLFASLSDPDSVRKALEQVGLGDWLASLPRGTHTPLGRLEQGAAELSGGQWQRVALARSVFGGAPVLILDEPTAALDPISEHRLYELFGSIGEAAGATVIQITHRLGAAVSADEIIVLDGGQAAQRGSHAELLRLGGLYAELYESQRSWYKQELPGSDGKSDSEPRFADDDHEIQEVAR